MTRNMKQKLLTFLICSAVMAPIQAHEDIKHEKNPAYVWDSYGNIVRDNYDDCVRTIDWKEDIEECGGKPKKATPPVAEAKPDPVKEEPKAEVKPEPAEEKPAKNVTTAEGAAVTTTAAIAAAKAGKPLDFNGFFENDGYALTSEAKEKLDKYAAYLNDHPEKKLKVTGHTDSKGSSAYNQKLSQKRADKVKEYLVSKNVEADRITTIGRGEELPIADNSTAEGKAKNRRVEIQIVD